ncbi:methylenetetrahydrofolate reductase [NAD(P)H] [Immundisolibacter sp.]|uniref:methylenetetrahydrofolate reductase [NAD(P)H] n=1 Tax=Immundisolibacter sp. TaxID=1934948 RepID=UPI003568F4F2
MGSERSFSFEFFPPRSDEAAARFIEARRVLLALDPAYVSVTFGAGGSTRDLTLDTVSAIQAEQQAPVAPHISCVGASASSIRELLDGYRGLGIRRLVALRGDVPSGMGDTPGEFRYANDLVAFIRRETGDWFHLEVAAYPEVHPQAKSARADMDAFVRKVRAGADGAITQYFFNADAYFRFREAATAAGVTVPIVPGVMPITNYTQLARFSAACGAEIPRWLARRLEDFGDDLGSLRAFGLDVTLTLCRRLLDGGVPGIHFYTLNRAEPSATLWQTLGLSQG